MLLVLVCICIKSLSDIICISLIFSFSPTLPRITKLEVNFRLKLVLKSMFFPLAGGFDNSTHFLSMDDSEFALSNRVRF